MKFGYIVAGIVAFLLFWVYDINSIKAKSKILKSLFFAGVLLLAAATGLLLLSGLHTGDFPTHHVVLFLILALIFLLLLIYTLFFALPFNTTYINESAKPKVCMVGIYGMCRHPGFWWFLGMYICIALAVPTLEMVIGAVIFCILNFIYIIMQDIWTFPKYFDDYDQYKEKVPFLVPTRASLQEGMKSLKF